MAHLSRREYRRQAQRREFRTRQAKTAYARSRAQSRLEFDNFDRVQTNRHKQPQLEPQTARSTQRVRLNFWQIFTDRPYVATAVIVLAIFFIMLKLWWGLLLLAILVGLGIFVIGHSHHPNRVLSLEFKMKAAHKLSMLRALQLGGSVIMFLSTYMRQVISVNFSSTCSTDSLQMVEGVLSNQGGTYGQQGSYFLNLLNTLTGGQLLSSYRYATNSAQMMNSGAGRWIIIWILLLMLGPAFCVLAQFFKEPHGRNVSLIAAIISTIIFALTPILMRRWVVKYAIQNQMSAQAANNAVTVGPMAFVALTCAFLVLLISIYRFLKKDQFH